MTASQKKIYREAMQRSRAMIQNAPPADESQPAPPPPKVGKTKKSKIGATSGDTSSNVLMDLRKAASHPMLFRRLFDDAKIKVMAKHCLMEPDFCESRYDYVVEDMEVMTDSELQHFCKRYKVQCFPFGGGLWLTPSSRSTSTHFPMTVISLPGRSIYCSSCSNNTRKRTSVF